MLYLYKEWVNFLVGGSHHWVLNYQRTTFFKIKRMLPAFLEKFSLVSSASVYLFFLEASAGHTEQCSGPYVSRGSQFAHP